MAEQNRSQPKQPKEPKPKKKLSHELLCGLSPEEFDAQARSLAGIESMTKAARMRLKAQLIERLKTPVDKPSWGPDWVRHGEKVAAPNSKPKTSRIERMRTWWNARKYKDVQGQPQPAPVAAVAMEASDQMDIDVISRNMEKSRQVSHYRPLYAASAVLAVAILLTAMFVDYHIIREVWTKALSNDYGFVPESLRSSVVFKSLQVVFAVLIVHFMLKITGAYGRNSMIAVAFVLALLMVGGLGYLVAYNNMKGGTSTAQDTQISEQYTGSSAIDDVLGPAAAKPAAATPAADGTDDAKEFSFGIKKPSADTLAAADSWFWLAFAGVVFFIVTTVAALYMQTAENNVRNFHIARDHENRRRQFAQLHMIEHVEEVKG